MFPSLAELGRIRGPYLLPLLALIASRVWMWAATPAPAEDAFITFRYARNLATGHGLVYNPGEHVMGFTSPVWTLWCTLGTALMHDPASWARAFGVLADVVTLLVGGALLAGAGVATVGVAAFTWFFAAWPYFAAVGVSGMETSACLALLVAAAAAVRGRRAGAGALLGLLAWSRPEGLVAAVALAIPARRRDQLVAGGIVLVGGVLLALAFGSPIPNSVLAKAVVYGTPGPWAGRHWWDWVLPVFLGAWPSTSDGTVLVIMAVVTGPAFVVGLRELWRHRDSGAAWATAAALLVWLGYIAAGAAYFWWYLALPLLGFGLAAAAGLPRIVRGRAIPAALLALTLSLWSMSWQLYAGRARAEANLFGTMARALAERCRPGDTVMLEPIGIIGYTAPVVVIDESGLVSPEVVRRRREGPGWYADIARERRPDWLVVRLAMLHGDAAFAGRGQPFRSAAERDSLFAAYRGVGQSGDDKDPTSIELFQRVR